MLNSRDCHFVHITQSETFHILETGSCLASQKLFCGILQIFRWL